MKQILQDMKNGNSTIATAPAPQISSGKLLIATRCSLISTGTERNLVDFGKASYLKKAQQQPEKVKMVLEKIKTDGLLTTIDAVQSKLAQPLLLGYCNVGTICEVGKGVHHFKVGERVVSNGAHADIVKIAQNLCARIPDKVSDQAAAFTVVASIGLQGIRLAQPTLGEAVVVIGVGLIGLLTVQLLRAQGCRVLAIDFDDQKLQLAQHFGAEICNPNHGGCPVAAGLAFSRGRGVDAVLITAATASNEPITNAAKMSRKRGRIILVGIAGLSINRADFYEKELSFQVSCSYGPGRYEAAYEEQGLDYPIGFVRWTEQRNFEAVLDMMASGQLITEPLISHQYAFEEAENAYKILTDDAKALGILLHYNAPLAERTITTVNLTETRQFNSQKPIIGMIGAGNYAARVLLPALNKARAQLHTLVTENGINSVIHGKKAGFSWATSDSDSVFSHKEINTTFVVTRHDSHAALVIKALQAGKHVFVEKPLAIHEEELAAIEAAWHIAMAANKPATILKL